MEEILFLYFGSTAPLVFYYTVKGTESVLEQFTESKQLKGSNQSKFALSLSLLNFMRFLLHVDFTVWVYVCWIFLYMSAFTSASMVGYSMLITVGLLCVKVPRRHPQAGALHARPGSQAGDLRRHGHTHLRGLPRHAAGQDRDRRPDVRRLGSGHVQVWRLLF